MYHVGGRREKLYLLFLPSLALNKHANTLEQKQNTKTKHYHNLDHETSTKNLFVFYIHYHNKRVQEKNYMPFYNVIF